VRFRTVASGLMIDRVRSVMGKALGGLGGRGPGL
jgi:hypothetical protein